MLAATLYATGENSHEIALILKWDFAMFLEWFKDNCKTAITSFQVKTKLKET